MKYRITESQYQKLKEDFNFEDSEYLDDENPFSGTQSPETLALIDLLVKMGIIDTELIMVTDDEMKIFGFAQPIFNDYFMDNQIIFEVDNSDGEIHVNVEGDGETEDYRLYGRHLNQIFNYIREIAEKTPTINWYIEEMPI
jgi:hypothetical protein